VVERTVRRRSEPNRTAHSLNDLRSPGQLDSPVLDEDYRAIRKEMQIVVLQFLQAAFKLNRFETDQNVFIGAKRRGSAALVIHQHKSVIGRRKRRVKICLVSIKERIRSRERLRWNI